MSRLRPPQGPLRATGGKLVGGKGENLVEKKNAASQLISCNTCHNVGLAGADLQKTSIGHGWQKGPRNAPTVLNAVFNIAQFRDGRAENLKAQPKGPVQASAEMNCLPERVVESLTGIPGYASLFRKSFPGENDTVTFDYMAEAIEVFEAKLLRPDSHSSWTRDASAATAASHGRFRLLCFRSGGEAFRRVPPRCE